MTYFFLDPMLVIPAVFLFIVAGGLYVAIMGPSRFHRDGCVGRLHRFCSTEFPEKIGTLCCCVLCCCRKARGVKAKDSCVAGCGRRNWVFVSLYIIFVWTVEVLYLVFALPYLRVRMVSKVISWSLVLLAEFLYAKAVLSDPGSVSSSEAIRSQLMIRFRDSASSAPLQSSSSSASFISKGGSNRRSNKRGGGGGKQQQETPSTATLTAMEDVVLQPRKWFSRAPYSLEEEYILNRRYPLDGLLYTQIAPPAEATVETQFKNAMGQTVGLGSTCTTCRIPKPSRSKHCNACGHCVRRFDHHCPWINNDVAENTQRYFVGFLFVHAISCVWAALDLYALMRQFLVDHRLWGWTYYRRGVAYPLDVVEYLTILTSFQMLPFFLFWFAAALAIVLFSFWGYVMTFVYRNLTMNDMNKIDEVLYFLETLKGPQELFNEVCRMRGRLKELRPDRDLMAGLKPPAANLLPPKPRGNPKGEEVSKDDLPELTPYKRQKELKKYRKYIRNEVAYALRHIYDRGIISNIMEVIFPTSCITPDLLTEVHALLLAPFEASEAKKNKSNTFYGSILNVQ